MKKNIRIILIISITKIILAELLYCQTYVSGNVEGVWSITDSPFYVTDHLTVQSEDSLIIEAGVHIYFKDYYRFLVLGCLKAVGNENDPIVFCGDSAMIAQKWCGLGFYNTKRENKIKYCLIKDIDQTNITNYPFDWKGCIHGENSNVIVMDCHVYQNTGKWSSIFMGYGGDHCEIKYNLVTENMGCGIHVTQCNNVIIKNNTVINNSDYGIWCSKLISRVEIINNIICDNSKGIGGHGAVGGVGNGSFYIAYNALWNNEDNYNFYDNYLPEFEIPLGTGDILDDPIFIGGDPFDYHLQNDSPCIDKGDPDSPSDPDGTRADMGALYFHQANTSLFTKISLGDIVTDGAQSKSCSWGDYNNDGNIDLFIANINGPNFLYKNNGDGTFEKISEGDIIDENKNSNGGSWGDYDNDGYLDLFIANDNTQGDNDNSLFHNNGDGTFTKVINGEIVSDGGTSFSASWGDYDNDGFIDLFVANRGGENNFLYHNDGDGTFTKIIVGDIVNDGGNSKNACWGDYDNDGDLDLFVSNVHGGSNFLYRNNGDSSFNKIMDGDIVNDESDSRGASWGDYDNDGDLDLFVSNRYTPKNFLYRYDGNDTFTKIIEGDIVNDDATSHSSSWGDFDNDGDLDLFVANVNNENNLFYINNGDGTFSKETNSIIVNENTYSYGASWCDYDKDGDLDLFVANDGNNILYRNNGNSNNWINIECIGTLSNKSAIGTKVRIKSSINGEDVWQMSEISGQTGYGSQNSLNVEFGIGDAFNIDSLIIEWDSGNIKILTNVTANQFLTFTEEVYVDTTAPDKPQNFQAVSGDSKVTLTWTSNTETDFDSYRIYKNKNQGFSPTTNDMIVELVKSETSYIDTNVINNNTYYYRLSALDSAFNESEFSDEVSATPMPDLSFSDILISDTSYNFGNVFVDSTKDINFKIKNIGQQTLDIYSISNSDDAFLIDPTTCNIVENDSLIFTITFQPSQEIIYLDTFRISCNDPDEPTVMIIVEGIGTLLPEPNITLSNDLHDFGDTPIFTSVHWQFLLENTGNADLRILDIQSNNSTFTVSPVQFLISPSGHKQVEVHFTPDSLKTETGKLTIISNDPENSYMDVHMQGRGIDIQAPEIVINYPQQTIWLNNECQISARIIDDWKVFRARINYRKGSEISYHNLPMNSPGDNIFSGAIPASSISFEGTEYYISAEDESGNITISDTLSHKIIFSDNMLTTNIPYSSYKTGYIRGGWHMISVPGTLNNPGISMVFNDENEIGNYGEPNWRLFSFEDNNNDGVNDGYKEYASNLESTIFRFSPGKSFWLKTNPEGSKVIFDVGAGYSLPLESQTINLKAGWNQIGNPFAFPIEFSPTESNIVNQLYLPDGSGGYQFSDIMLPWAGYFVYVDGNQQTDLTLYPVSSVALDKSITNNVEWLVQMRVSCGNCKDDINYFGISNISSNNWDQKDYPEPPFIGTYISLYFSHEDWNTICRQYTTDIRNNLDEGQIWKFEVMTNQSSSEITIDFNLTGITNSEIKLVLYDMNRNRSVNIEDVNQYTYQRMKNENKSGFQLIAGDQDFVNTQMHEIRSHLPQRYHLCQNYPNPFNETTMIKFELPRSSLVNLSLYNILGERIKVLADGFYSIGSYELKLESNDLTSGLYFYILRVEGNIYLKKMIVLK